MKNILFVLPNIPYPLTTGGNQAMFNGVKSVKNDVNAYIVYSVPFYNKKTNDLKAFQNLLKDVHVESFVYNPLKGICDIIKWALVRIDSKLKRNVGSDDRCKQMPHLFKFPSKEYVAFINDFVKANKIDVVQIEMCSGLAHVLTLPSNVKKIFVHHELNYAVNDLLLKQLGVTQTRKAYAELAKVIEIGLLNRYDAVVTLSEVDKKKLIEEGVHVPVYQSIAVVGSVPDVKNPNSESNVLTFVGPSSHSPNYVGVSWFLEKCWSRLLQQDASYCLRIIGNWSESHRAEIKQKYKNVEFAGFVPDLAKALNNSIMIVPITVGSGIRMKILEAASLGIPFVSTSVGAEGLPFESGRDCFKADTPENFVKAIVDLKDKSLREKFAQNANAIVKEKYSMDALRKNRLEIYDKVLNGKN